jgi:hypothetical protein
MQLSVARLCLDCQEIHENDRCPICTSEAFAFMTRWVKVDAPAQGPSTREKPADRTQKADAYRRILSPAPQRTTTPARWLRKAGIVVATGYLARWGWNIASHVKHSSRADADTDDNTRASSR